MVKMVTALIIAKLYCNHVWKVHGLPQLLISDHSPQFTAQLMKDLGKMLKIDLRMSTAFHPQMDGQMEWVNRDLQQYLRLFTAEKQGEWSEWLALAQFTYNN